MTKSGEETRANEAEDSLDSKDLLPELIYRIQQSTTTGEDPEGDSIDYKEDNIDCKEESMDYKEDSMDNKGEDPDYGLCDTKEKDIVIKKEKLDDISDSALAMSVEDCSTVSTEDDPESKSEVSGLAHTIEPTSYDSIEPSDYQSREPYPILTIEPSLYHPVAPTYRISAESLAQLRRDQEYREMQYHLYSQVQEKVKSNVGEKAVGKRAKEKAKAKVKAKGKERKSQNDNKLEEKILQILKQNCGKSSDGEESSKLGKYEMVEESDLIDDGLFDDNNDFKKSAEKDSDYEPDDVPSDEDIECQSDDGDCNEKPKRKPEKSKEKPLEVKNLMVLF